MWEYVITVTPRQSAEPARGVEGFVFVEAPGFHRLFIRAQYTFERAPPTGWRRRFATRSVRQRNTDRYSRERIPGDAEATAVPRGATSSGGLGGAVLPHRWGCTRMAQVARVRASLTGRLRCARERTAIGGGVGEGGSARTGIR